ncbi:spore cortex biosynthesis protein YabQ [Sediminibacillus albus]|uniref:Spore cortex biosynthesis protein YabQ n=1 Tax=Sediminibacillus albus TaxID=407036 RepID=A0A1G9D9F3_9BACI|nr:spore cortex biosynthesis protein YabQ [Sediminibacillus albus]SDK60501.1 spore cortex biosynthesis protein YabQ [Sediminibacillus albus]
MTLTVQFAAILTMIAGGVYVGAAIDTFRRFEKGWKHRLFFSYSLEICFWLLQTLILFYLLYRVNQGELRLYIFLAILCGFAAYKALFEQMYRKLLEKLIDLTRLIYRFFSRLFKLLVIKPITGLFRLIFLALTGFWIVLLWLLAVIVKVLIFPFQLLIKMVWALMPQYLKKYFYKVAGFYSKIKNTLRKWWRSIHNKRR